MQAEDYVAHARDTLGFSEERIAKNRYAIEKGLFYGAQAAVAENSHMAAQEQVKATKTDAERSESKARHGKPYTTPYAVAWCREQGWTILNREHYSKTTGRRHDVFGGWDILAWTGTQNVLIQAYGPGEGPAHIRKLDTSGAKDKAVKIGARMLLLEFTRGDKVPKVTEVYP
jgi:hypothetical protein